MQIFVKTLTGKTSGLSFCCSPSLKWRQDTKVSEPEKKI